MKQTLNIFFTLILVLVLSAIADAQNPARIMSYNLLNYPGSDTTTRNPYFRTIIANTLPDILVAQEVTLQNGVNGFLNNVLKSATTKKYAAGLFIDGPDTDNAIFYDTTLFSFIANNPIVTALRHISEFVIKSKASGDTLRIYSVHLKASTGSSNEILRAAEVDSLRKVTNKLPPNSNFIVLGDYNIYRYSESAFEKLLNQTSSGYLIDPQNVVGNWGSNSSFAIYHTQSTRTASFGGGATGGMDDRFDMILMSQAIMDQGGITYNAGTYTTYGNDSLHYDKAINSQPTNAAVGQLIADALHFASDHIPVFATFNFVSIDTSITLNLTALIHGFYNGTSMFSDTVKVFLHRTTPPYAKVDSVKIKLDSLGFGSGKFTKTAAGNYYISVTHRNGLETWSKFPLTFTTAGVTYNFTTSSSQAYGDNLKLKSGKWCIYNGDVNQDGIVDLSDLLLVDNDNFNFVTGYVITDTNGDGIVDLSDLSTVDINSLNYVIKIVP